MGGTAPKPTFRWVKLPYPFCTCILSAIIPKGLKIGSGEVGGEKNLILFKHKTDIHTVCKQK